MEKVHDIIDEASHPPWARFLGEFGNLQEHKSREHKECVQYQSKIIKRTI